MTTAMLSHAPRTTLAVAHVDPLRIRAAAALVVAMIVLLSVLALGSGSGSGGDRGTTDPITTPSSEELLADMGR
jgi:hypothetical protein